MKILFNVIKTNFYFIFALIAIAGCGRANAPTEQTLSNVNAIVEQGGVWEKDGRLKEALAEYDKALQKDPKSFLAYKYRGTAHTRLGAYDEALADYNKAIELNPAYAPSYYNRGVLYSHMQNLEKSIADYSKTIELDPQYINAVLNRAGAYQAKGDVQKAIEDYTRALAIQPNHTAAHMARADAYMSLGKVDEAVKDISALIEINPKDGTLYFDRGSLYAQKMEYDKAVADYSKGLELMPNAGKEAYAQRSFLYEQIGDQEKAQADLEKVKSLDPKYYKEMLLSKASYLISNKQVDKAIEIYTTIINFDPGSIEGYYQRALAYLFQEKQDLAIADYTAAIERKPDEVRLYNNRGAIYAKREEDDKALADFNKAVEIKPDYVNSYFNRAGVYLHRKEYDKSWADIKKIRELGAQVPPEFIKRLEDVSGQKDPNPPTSVPTAANQGHVAASVDQIGEKPEDGKGILGGEGQNDSVEFSFGALTVASPTGWQKEANVQFSPATKAFLLYSKSSGNLLPAIAVTKDEAPPNISSPQEFTVLVKEFLKQLYPEMEGGDIREETVNGRKAAYMEFTVNGLDKVKQRHAWYQFLVKDHIVSVQYTNTDYQFSTDVAALKTVVESLKINEK